MPFGCGQMSTNHQAEPLPHGFSGRDWLFAVMEDWLKIKDERAERFFLIEGAPGCGKTTFCNQLVRISKAAVPSPVGCETLMSGCLSAAHFCSRRDRHTLNPMILAENLAGQLAANVPGFASKMATAVTGSPIHIQGTISTGSITDSNAYAVYIGKLIGFSAETAFARGVRTPLDALYNEGFDKTVVILIDALDEALAFDGNVGIVPLLADLENLSRKVRFVVTARQDYRVHEALSRAGLTRQVLSSAQGARDLQTHLERVLADSDGLRSKLSPGLAPSEFTEVVSRKADGNFLALRQHLLTLEAKAQSEPLRRADLEALPEGLDKIYREYVTRLAGNHDAAWRSRNLPTLAVLAAAQEFLTEAQITTFTKLSRRETRESLFQLEQLLEKRLSAPPAVITYTLYHRSFAEFLFDGEKAGVYWCDLQDAHRAFLKPFAPRAGSWVGESWQPADDYTLRQGVFHALQSEGLTAASSLLDTGFWRAKSTRFGTDRGLLEDARLLLAAAEREANLPLTFRWGWTSILIRERIAHLFHPDMIPLLVRAGQSDKALEILDALDIESATFDTTKVDDVRVKLAEMLGEIGETEQALKVARGSTTEWHRGTAITAAMARVATRDPALAVQILQGEPFAPPSADLCRALATHVAFVDHALHFAKQGRDADESGELIEAVTMTVAIRDPVCAVTLANQHLGFERFEMRCAGNRWWRNADSVRAHVALLAAPSDSQGAFDACRHLQTLHERVRALVALTEIVGVSRPDLAFRCIDSLGHDAAASGFARRLAVAKLVGATRDQAVQAECRCRYENTRPAARRNDLQRDLYLLAHTNVLHLRDNDLAARMVTEALSELGTLFEHTIDVFEDFFCYPSEAVCTFAGALAAFDATRAIDFINRLVPKFSQVALFQYHASEGVIRTLAEFDPDAAIRLAKAVAGSGLHGAYRQIVAIVARNDLDRAMRIIDAMEDRYVLGKQRLYGFLGERMSTDGARALLSKIPAFQNSSLFEKRMVTVESALSRGLRLQRGADIVQRNEASVVDKARAEELARGIPDDLERARFWISLVKKLGPEHVETFLRSARESAELLPEQDSNRDRLLTWIGNATAAKSPWEALRICRQIRGPYRAERVLKAAMQTLLRSDRSWDYVDLTRRLIVAFDLNKDAWFSFDDRWLALAAIQEVDDGLGPEDQMRLLESLMGLDPAGHQFLPSMLLAWRAATRPATALTFIENAPWFNSFMTGRVLAWLARKDPDAALRHCLQLANGKLLMNLATRFGFFEIISELAGRDVSRAIACLRTTESSIRGGVSDLALRNIAVIAARTNWDQGLSIASGINSEIYRVEALTRILAAADDSPNTDLVLKHFAEEALKISCRREALFVELIDLALLAEALAFETVVSVVAALCRADYDLFYLQIKKVVRLLTRHSQTLEAFQKEPERLRVLLRT